VLVEVLLIKYRLFILFELFSFIVLPLASSQRFVVLRNLLMCKMLVVYSLYFTDDQLFNCT